MKKSVLFFIGFAVSVLIIAAVNTTIDDFFMPGSQPGQSGNLEHPGKCDNCHGGYDQAVEPAYNWRGNMMAQAMRDPLFLACLAIANQDAPESGDLCIRCHAPDGWLNGRSTPTDGSALNANDREGVQCDFCHKLVKPTPLDVNPYPGDNDYTTGTYASDQEYLGTISMIPYQSGNGMYLAHSANAKRGPYVDAEAKHQMHYSPFHKESDLCGTCHDVSNPAFDKNGNPVIGFSKTGDNFITGNMLPVERTFSEWSVSEYATSGVSGTPFGGNKNTVSTCQDCHMRDVSGYGANKRRIPFRNDLPLHDMTGGNTFVPDLVAELYPDEVDPAALRAGKERALFMLQNAATMELEVEQQSDGTFEAEVEIVNQTGHKLPSGYPEGRRIWINLQAFDESGSLVYESGAYDSETAELDKDGTKIYEIKLGMSQAVADAANANNPYTYSYSAGESFHFVLNNIVVKDNRIPPRGFTNAAFNQIQSPVVGYTYEDGDHYDETVYTLPANTSRVTATLYYQTVSKEYVTFLRDKNETNNAGNILYDLWERHGKSAPVVMVTKTVNVSGTTTPPVAEFTGSPTTGQAPLTVSFTDLSTNSPSEWLWNFGDGMGSSDQNPSHTYTSAGTYTVSLTASNSGGSSTETKTGYIVVTAPSPTDPISAQDVLFTTNSHKGGRSNVTATVTLTAPVDGATVSALFVGPKNSSVTGTTTNGSVVFESPKVKGTANWCLDITDIQAAGYYFTGVQTFCQSKSAFIKQTDAVEESLSVYPNPFSDRLTFEFSRPEECDATLELFDASGKKLAVLFDQPIKTNQTYRVEYVPDGLPDGMIFYKFVFGDDIQTGKVFLTK